MEDVGQSSLHSDMIIYYCHFRFECNDKSLNLVNAILCGIINFFHEESLKVRFPRRDRSKNETKLFMVFQ